MQCLSNKVYGLYLAFLAFDFFFKEEYILFFEVSPNSIINICDYNFSL